MKKIIFLMALFTVFFTGQQTFAQSYLSDVSVNLNTQVISGNFLRADFLAGNTELDSSFNISLELSDFGTPILTTLSGLGSSGILTPDIQSFEIPLGDIYTRAGDTWIKSLSTGDEYDSVTVLWRYDDGFLVRGDAISFAGRIVDADDDSGLIIDPPFDDTIPVITVDWETPQLLNSKPDDPASGVWYYKIKSNGNVTKSPDGNAYLTMMKIENTMNTRLPITLGEYLSETGEEFSVAHPPCIVSSCEGLTSSPIQPGYHYEVFFSHYQNGSEVLHENILTFPGLPEEVTDATGYITIDSTSFITDDNGSTYLSIKGQVLKKVNGSYKFTVRAIDEDGSRQDYSYDIAAVPGDIGTYSVPNASYIMDTSYDSYQVHISYLDGDGSDDIIYTYEAGSIEEPSDNNQGNGGGSSGNTYNQREILKSGIVPIDCGYDIGPKGRGHMCGFVDIIELIQNVIEYIFILILPIAALVFAYAGFLLLTGGSAEAKRTAAKKAMTSVVIGVVIVMLAWLLVKTVLVALGASDGFTMYLDF